MAKVWQIKGWDGQKPVFEREVAGNLTEPEVSAMLQRLTCRYLSDMEIIKAQYAKVPLSMRRSLSASERKA